MLIEGRYVKMVQVDYSLVDIVYHNKSNRLYVSTDGNL